MVNNLLSGFNEYRMLILNELERNDKRLDSIEETLNLIQRDLVKLQMKSGAWGALMGTFTAIGAYFLAHY